MGDKENPYGKYELNWVRGMGPARTGGPSRRALIEGPYGWFGAGPCVAVGGVVANRPDLHIIFSPVSLRMVC